jgi:hypothetical protein
MLAAQTAFHRMSEWFNEQWIGNDVEGNDRNLVCLNWLGKCPRPRFAPVTFRRYGLSQLARLLMSAVTCYAQEQLYLCSMYTWRELIGHRSRTPWRGQFVEKLFSRYRHGEGGIWNQIRNLRFSQRWLWILLSYETWRRVIWPIVAFVRYMLNLF